MKPVRVLFRPPGVAWRLLIQLAVLATGLSAPPMDPSAPLRISGSHRYLIDRRDVPFLLQGDAAWSLIANTNKEDAAVYLRNRREKGFNAILVNLIEHKFAKNAPRNVYGDAPFAHPSDFAAPNEKYFEYADWVIRQATANDIVVLLAPVYLGFPGTDEGFFDEVIAGGPEKCLAYGRFLGRRYRDFDNIIWVLGGDRDPGPAREDVDMVASGIREFDQRHLMTAHCHGGSNPVEQYPGSWLQIGTTYNYEIVHLHLLWDYNRKPVLPYFLIESIYEGEHNASAVQIRRQAYWSILCGEFGHVMGNHPIWDFSAGWQAALDAPGSVAMMRWGKLFRSRPWYELIPDQEHKTVTDGLGEFWGNDYVAAAATPDGSTLIAYLPSARTITVNLAKLVKGRVNAWWFNPRTGGATAAGSFPTDGGAQFTPPAEGDWVLVVDDAAKQRPPPGSDAAAVPADRLNAE
ncbi:MAG TPA: glycoside hydrolase family 140 protein [Opitutaceae bacterium]|nr:glycoside hydrolase family 140 protein [Opitutaceae bacterium]